MAAAFIHRRRNAFGFDNDNRPPTVILNREPMAPFAMDDDRISVSIIINLGLVVADETAAAIALDAGHGNSVVVTVVSQSGCPGGCEDDCES